MEIEPKKTRKRKGQDIENPNLKRSIFPAPEPSPNPRKTTIYSYITNHTQLLAPGFDVAPEDIHFSQYRDYQFFSKEVRPVIDEEEKETFSYQVKLNLTISRTKRELERLQPSKKKEKKDKKKKEKFLSSTAKNNLFLPLAIASVEKGYSQKYLGSLLGIGNKKISRCLQKKKHNKPAIIEKRGRKTKVQQRFLEFLEEFLMNPKNQITTLKDLRRLLIKRFNLQEKDMTIYLVHKMVKMLSFTRKRASIQVNSAQSKSNIDKREILSRLMIKNFSQNKLIIFIDETGFNQHVVPICGYSKKGKKFTLQCPPKGTNHSVIAAVTKEKILCYQIFQGSVKSQDFGAFVLNMITNIDEVKGNLENAILFLDNASIHRAKILSNLREIISFQFNVGYSPFLNPIEEFFGLWKFHFRKNFSAQESDVSRRICMSITHIKAHHILSFFYHSLSFYNASLNRQKIE